MFTLYTGNGRPNQHHTALWDRVSSVVRALMYITHFDKSDYPGIVCILKVTASSVQKKLQITVVRC